MSNKKEAALVNIPRQVDDTFYRYKMPRLLTKIEGRGNGIKTVLLNMSDIAAAFGRPASCMRRLYRDG
jgi:translation initiation factor 5